VSQLQIALQDYTTVTGFEPGDPAIPEIPAIPEVPPTYGKCGLGWIDSNTGMILCGAGEYAR
jgi:hypothetical protein